MRWRMLAILFLARCALGFQFQSAASVGPVMIERIGISYAELGLLIGLHTTPGVFLSLPGGIIGQWLGDKRGVLIGFGLMTLGGLIGGLGDSFAAACVGRVLAGMGNVFLSVLMTKMATDWFEGKELVTALSILFASWPMGIGLALLAVGPIASGFGWSAGLLAAGILSAFGLVLIALFARESPTPTTQQDTGKREVWRLSRRDLLAATLAGLVWSLYNQPALLIQGFAPSFLAERGTGTAGAGALVSLTTWTFLPAMIIGGWLIQRTGTPKLGIILCCVPLAGAMALLPVAPASAIPFLFALCGILTGAPTGAVMSLPAAWLAPSSRALGMGVFYTWHYLGMAATPALAGWLVDRTGSGDAPFVLGAVTGLGAVAALLGARYLQGDRGGGNGVR